MCDDIQHVYSSICVIHTIEWKREADHTNGGLNIIYAYMVDIHSDIQKRRERIAAVYS